MTEGDVLILVQRRSDLFHEIIRACKVANLAIAGADRLKLGGELAVRDIAALLSFVATDDDDLSLAAALRSPLFGLTEAQLYDLAQGRDGKRLWEVLRNHPDHAETVSILADLRDRSDFLRPYDLIERLLTRHDGRRRLIARLGPEAEDGIDELLGQALAYERVEVPSLTGFLGWMETDEVEVKRQPDSAGNRIRVMTVHGAKGLEAPVVILPDTADRNPSAGGELMTLAPGAIAWRTGADASPPQIATARDALRERQQEENMRLLYVAMTRAQSWLIVAAAGKIEKEGAWYNIVAQGMEHAGGVQVAGATGFGPIQRLSLGDWPEDRPDSRAGQGPTPAEAAPLPHWATSAAPTPTGGLAALTPSGLGGAKVMPGEGAGLSEEAAMLRGTRLHLLLEHLPQWPRADWPGVAQALLAATADPDLPADNAALLAEAQAVLSAPALAFLFAPEALAEVEITSPLGPRRMLGTIDRLILSPGQVLAVDYKSNAVVPDRPEEVPIGLLRQMGAYAAALERIYPDRTVQTALLWTRTAQLMPLPQHLVHGALATTTFP